VTVDNLSLAVVLTASGATAAAALITGLIAMLKQVAVIGPRIDAGNEPSLSFVLAGVLVLLAFVSVGVFTVPAAFAAFLAWFGIAQIAMGVHDTVKSATARPEAPGAATPITPSLP
jgi:uncharacterized membrane protein HdeD (DUF308 family)